MQLWDQGEFGQAKLGRAEIVLKDLPDLELQDMWVALLEEVPEEGIEPVVLGSVRTQFTTVLYEGLDAMLLYAHMYVICICIFCWHCHCEATGIAIARPSATAHLLVTPAILSPTHHWIATSSSAGPVTVRVSVRYTWS